LGPPLLGFGVVSTSTTKILSPSTKVMLPVQGYTKEAVPEAEVLSFLAARGYQMNAPTPCRTNILQNLKITL